MYAACHFKTTTHTPVVQSLEQEEDVVADVIVCEGGIQDLEVLCRQARRRQVHQAGYTSQQRQDRTHAGVALDTGGCKGQVARNCRVAASAEPAAGLIYKCSFWRPIPRFREREKKEHVSPDTRTTDRMTHQHLDLITYCVVDIFKNKAGCFALWVAHHVQQLDDVRSIRQVLHDTRSTDTPFLHDTSHGSIIQLWQVSSCHAESKAIACP